MGSTRTACGFVLLRETAGEVRYLLLRNAERAEWGLPKGHAESEDADELTTARRETEEETGLTDLRVAEPFRRVLEYPAERAGTTYHKRVVYFLARWQTGEVRLSPEHDRLVWADYADAAERLPYASLRSVLREAALFVKDPALFRVHAHTQEACDRHLASLPHATDALLAHLRGGAALARTLAEALREAGVVIDPEATAAGTLLHDLGRALGDHADHPRAGLRHLRQTPLAPYGFACLSHFTKGAAPEDLARVGVDADMLREVGGWIELERLTWPERCAALADACMKQDQAVDPEVRFADLHDRYENHDLIDLQARRTAAIRDDLAQALGTDPLALLPLA